MEITENILIANGFKKKVTSWYGNGAGYQLRPEDGGSMTTQVDYVLPFGDVDFIVRNTLWIWGKALNCESSWMSFHFCRWYPKCNEEIPCHDPSKIENLLLAYRLATGNNLLLINYTPEPPNPGKP